MYKGQVCKKYDIKYKKKISNKHIYNGQMNNQLHGFISLIDTNIILSFNMFLLNRKPVLTVDIET